MFEDYRLLVAFAFSFGFDTILAYLSQVLVLLPRRKYLSVYSQDVPRHILCAASGMLTCVSMILPKSEV